MRHAPYMGGGVNWNITLQWILKELDGKVLTKFMLLRIGTTGGML